MKLNFSAMRDGAASDPSTVASWMHWALLTFISDHCKKKQKSMQEVFPSFFKEDKQPKDSIVMDVVFTIEGQEVNFPMFIMEMRKSFSQAVETRAVELLAECSDKAIETMKAKLDSMKDDALEIFDKVISTHVQELSPEPVEPDAPATTKAIS